MLYNKNKKLKPGQVRGMQSVTRHLEASIGPIKTPRKVVSADKYHWNQMNKNHSPHIKFNRTKRCKVIY